MHILKVKLLFQSHDQKRVKERTSKTREFSWYPAAVCQAAEPDAENYAVETDSHKTFPNSSDKDWKCCRLSWKSEQVL